MLESLPEQLMEHRAESLGAPAVGLPFSPELPSIPPQDALREAMLCLEIAGRQLRGGSAAPADEVLNLLFTATTHLQRALES